MAETTLVSSLFECVTNDFYKIRKKINRYSINNNISGPGFTACQNCL